MIVWHRNQSSHLQPCWLMSQQGSCQGGGGEWEVEEVEEEEVVEEIVEEIVGEMVEEMVELKEVDRLSASLSFWLSDDQLASFPSLMAPLDKKKETACHFFSQQA